MEPKYLRFGLVSSNSPPSNDKVRNCNYDVIHTHFPPSIFKVQKVDSAGGIQQTWKKNMKIFYLPSCKLSIVLVICMICKGVSSLPMFLRMIQNHLQNGLLVSPRTRYIRRFLMRTQRWTYKFHCLYLFTFRTCEKNVIFWVYWHFFSWF